MTYSNSYESFVKNIYYNLLVKALPKHFTP